MIATFLINSFNRASLLNDALRAIENLAARTNLTVSVVVFEAGSTDQSHEMIRSFAERMGDYRVRVIHAQRGEDSSFAAGLNRAATLAIQEFNPEYLICFETDNYCDNSEPFEAAIRLLEAKRELGAVGFTVQKRDGEPCGYGEPMPTVLALGVGPRISDWLQWRGNKERWAPASQDMPAWSYCDIVYTSPLVVSTEAWKRVRGMDAERFPFSACDLDLAVRMKKHGLRMAVIQCSGVFHDNLGQLSEWSAKRSYSFHQGTFRFLLRHRGWYTWLIVPLLVLRHVIELLILIFVRKSWRNAKVKGRAALLIGAIRGYP